MAGVDSKLLRPNSTAKRKSSGTLEVLSPDCKQVQFEPSRPPTKENEPSPHSSISLSSLQRKQLHNPSDLSSRGKTPVSNVTSLSQGLTNLSFESNNQEEDKALGEEGDSSSSSEEEPQTDQEILREAGVVDFSLDDVTCGEDGLAPLDLITNFLRCIMGEHYIAARILCEQIIRIEPDNKTARDFYPVILEKIDIERNKDSEEDDSDCTEEDDGDIESSSLSSDENEQELTENLISNSMGGSIGQATPPLHDSSGVYPSLPN